MKIDGCTALITGSSAGIGREFARQLAGHAGGLVLVARRRQRLEELRDELLKRDPNLNVHIRVVDLADKSQIDELVQRLEKEKIEIDLLINNAGLGDLGPFATSDPERIHRITQVNMAALTLLTRWLLPGMIARKRGAILNVSSSAGFLPIAEFSVYAASKAYVTSFSEGLRAELRGAGVSVCALCPGPVHTEFTEVAQRPSGPPNRSGPEFVYVSAENVARAGLAAVEQDRPLIIPGFVMKLGMLFVRLTPMSIVRLASRFSRHA
ncbi:MAG: SDR family oxidoreductase [Verrucomicrobiota bacterium]|nr:SDR family oxidoreductase [Verrucomicrobiota bacterium]